jgi:predicted lipid-binding transport protein (Tim44 family)
MGDGAPRSAYISPHTTLDLKGRRITMDILQILFFAGLAVFLAVRLYSALGKPQGRTHEDHVREERERAAAPGAPAQPRPAPISGETPASPAFTGPAAEGLANIAAADLSFDPDGFAGGARQAYEMIVVAYAKGDRDALEPLLTERVKAAYDNAITQREEAGHAVTTEIERVKRAEIVEASLNDNRAKVRVAFSAEIASETRDRDGEIVSGDLNQLKTVDEIWSFERDVTSGNPNWRLASVKPA